MKTQKLSSGDNIVVLDLETTGLNPQVNEIIEICAWHFCDGVLKSKFVRRIKPERYITSDIMRLTGITMEDLKDCETIDNVLPEFIDFLSDYPLVGYNIDFDYRFLCAKSSALGLDITLGGNRRGIDVLKLVRKYYNLESYKLKNVAEYFNIDLEGNFHSAEFDSYITKLIYDRFPKERPYLLSKTNYGRPKSKATLEW